MSNISNLCKLEEELQEHLENIRNLINEEQVDQANGTFFESEAIRYVRMTHESRLLNKAEEFTKRSKEKIRPPRYETYPEDSKPSLKIMTGHFDSLADKVISILNSDDSKESKNILENFEYYWNDFVRLSIEDVFYRRSYFYKALDVNKYLSYLNELPEGPRRHTCNFPDDGCFFGIEEINSIKSRLKQAGLMLYFMSTHYGLLEVEFLDVLAEIDDMIDIAGQYCKYAEYEPCYLTDSILFVYKWDMRILEWHKRIEEKEGLRQKEMLLSYRI